jgi:hypothetical protein
MRRAEGAVKEVGSGKRLKSYELGRIGVAKEEGGPKKKSKLSELDGGVLEVGLAC